MLYKNKTVRKIIRNIDDKKSSKLSVLQTLRFIDKPCRNVTTTKIVNCFKSCGFLLGSEKNDILSPNVENTVTDK